MDLPNPGIEQRFPELISPWFHTTPVFALAYHFRATKWLWIGLHTQYVHYEDLEIGDLSLTVPGICDRRYHAVSIMPELRFSWFNRPHVTLYSELAFGVTKFIGKVTNYDLAYADNSVAYLELGGYNSRPRTVFPSLHVHLRSRTRSAGHDQPQGCHSGQPQ